MTRHSADLAQIDTIRGHLAHQIDRTAHFRARATTAPQWQRKYDVEEAAYHAGLRDHYAKQLSAMLGVPAPAWGAPDSEFAALAAMQVQA